MGDESAAHRLMSSSIREPQLGKLPSALRLMAKKKDSISKSQFIRDMLASNPQADFASVKAKGEEQGLKIAGSLYYMVKSKAGKARRKAKREKAVAASGTMNARSPVDVVRRVKELANDVGGLKNLMQLVSLLSE